MVCSILTCIFIIVDYAFFLLKFFLNNSMGYSYEKHANYEVFQLIAYLGNTIRYIQIRKSFLEKKNKS